MGEQLKIAFVRGAALIFAAIFLPHLLMAAYLVVTRGLVNWISNYCDFVAIAVSVGVGASCLWSLGLKGTVRVLVTVAYAIIGSMILFVFALTFICQVYNRCM